MNIDCKSLIKEILEKSKSYNCQVNCPKDVVVSKKIDGIGKIKDINNIEEDEMILDIGPKTIDSIRRNNK